MISEPEETVMSVPASRRPRTAGKVCRLVAVAAKERAFERGGVR